MHSAHMQQLSVNIGEHSGQVTLYLYSIANISTIIINIIIIVTVINTTIFIKVTSLQRNLKKFRKVEGMGGEYICVTGCIIAQLTRAWIEPFQPNNPLATNTLYMCMGTVYELYTDTNTQCIHTQ